MRSAGVIAVWVRAGACFSGNALCALACAVSARRTPRTTNRPAACMRRSPEEEGREISPFGCALSCRGLVRNSRPAGRAAQRPRQNPETCRLSLTPGHRPVQQDDDDPREPACPLAPAQGTEQEPGLRYACCPRLPIALDERERARKDAVGVEADRPGPRDIPDAGHLAPAVVVARADDHEVVAGGEPEHLAAQVRRKPQRFRRAVDDLEPVDAGYDERAEIVVVVAPVLGERRDTQRALTLYGREDPNHARGALAKAVTRHRLDRTDRDDVLLVHAPLDPRQQADRYVGGKGQGTVVYDVVIGHIRRLESLTLVPRGELRERPPGSTVVRGVRVCVIVDDRASSPSGPRVGHEPRNGARQDYSGEHEQNHD